MSDNRCTYSLTFFPEAIATRKCSVSKTGRVFVGAVSYNQKKRNTVIRNKGVWRVAGSAKQSQIMAAQERKNPKLQDRRD